RRRTSHNRPRKSSKFQRFDFVPILPGSLSALLSLLAGLELVSLLQNLAILWRV
ncbi:hypothetical protein Gotri_014593, partial [Gossypium trilobum]|nr:hypothetical protein [Gossypium trilobum]